MSDSESVISDNSEYTERSFHCGCPCDPYPDDPFGGYDAPAIDNEGTHEAKKEEGVKHHECKKLRSKISSDEKMKKKKKAVCKSQKKGKTKQKIHVDKDDFTHKEDIQTEDQ